MTKILFGVIFFFGIAYLLSFVEFMHRQVFFGLTASLICSVLLTLFVLVKALK